MGYTHYWTQKRNFTSIEWAHVSCEIRDILVEARRRNILLGNWRGEPSSPEFNADSISFNGVGDQHCETFRIERKRSRPYPGGKLGWSFCKTRHEPYDTAVTAVLIYLASIYGYEVASDGTYLEWIDGFNLVTKALHKNYQPLLAIPLPIVEPALT